MVHRKISPSAKVLLKIVLVAWKLLGSNSTSASPAEAGLLAPCASVKGLQDVSHLACIDPV